MVTLKNKGFTLIESAIVMAIGGLLIAGLTSGFISHMKAVKLNETNEKLETINTALQQYLQINNKLPCPASRTAAIDTAGFAIEASTTDCTTVVLPGLVNVAGQVNADVVIGNNTVALCPAPAAPAPAPAAWTVPSPVKIGSLPVRTLNLPDEYLVDGWGNRFTYAVSANLATVGGFRQNCGSISVHDSNDVAVENPLNEIQYILVSHGANGVGAITLSGTVGSPCPATAAMEVRNCDNADSIFRRTLLVSNAAATSFDDILIFSIQRYASIPPGAVVAFNTNLPCPVGWSDYNTGVGRVIIGAGNFNSSVAPGPSPLPPGHVAWTDIANYVVGATGGYQTWPLIGAEVPDHQHNIATYLTGADVTVGILRGPTTAASIINTPTVVAGGTPAAIDNRMPYVALKYCLKN